MSGTSKDKKPHSLGGIAASSDDVPATSGRRWTCDFTRTHHSRSRTPRTTPKHGEGADAVSKDADGLGGVATPEMETDSSSYESEYTYTEYTVASNSAEKPKGAAKKEEKKDDIVHFDWSADMRLDSRYRIIRLLGDGTFGRVLLAEDERWKRQVAVKVIRDVEKYRRCAKREAELLRDIRDADPDNRSRCVRLHGKFLYDGRFFCLVCEVLGASLYDILKQNRYRGFCMQDIQPIMKQCLQGLSFLHDEMSMAHTDLKLENILFQTTEEPVHAAFPREGMHASSRHRLNQYVRPASAAIKLIDFGNATYDDDHHSSVISTRQYRAPEVILQLGWNERSDLWSMGCILLEIYTGDLLFRTHGNLEHLALIEHIIEPLPQYMLEEASDLAKEEFLTDATGSWDLRREELSADAAACKKLASTVVLSDLVLPDHRLMLQCAALMLRPEPGRRSSAGQTLTHPFFSAHFAD